MSTPRLRKQFETLYARYNADASAVQIDDIADLLCCTRRNTRMVLSKMSEERWIQWNPAVGRGKLSSIVFNTSPDVLNSRLVKQYINDGKLDVALTVLDGDRDELLTLINQTLGVSHNQGKQAVKVPYYRPLHFLKPALAVRRSEQHLMQQIFNGLTQLNSKGEIIGDIAHHWERINPKLWRFYLRPNIAFHNGKLLSYQDIKETFEQLSSNYVFQHIAEITSPMTNVIDFMLSEEDHYFDSKLTQFNAKIVPAQLHHHPDFSIYPIGTGPYKVVENSDVKLAMNAHDDYFGYRSLIDSIEVLILPDVPPIRLAVKSENSEQQGWQYHEKVEVDKGSTYLLFNRKTGIAQEANWHAYLAQTITPLLLLNELDNSNVDMVGLFNAYGLLPGLQHCLTRATLNYEIPSEERVVILGYERDHPLYPFLGEVIKKRLAQDGIKLNIATFETNELLEEEKIQEVDIWLRGMSLGTNRPEALLSWLFAFNEIERSMPIEEFEQLSGFIKQWQSTPNQPFPTNKLCQYLVSNYHIIPLFHGWLGINEGAMNSIQNASCNGLGWFDFEQLWIKPDIMIEKDNK